MAGPPQPKSHPPPGDAVPPNSTDPGSVVAGPGAPAVRVSGRCRARWHEEHLVGKPVRDELRIGIARRREKGVLCGA